MAYLHPHKNKYAFYNYLILAGAAISYFALGAFTINKLIQINIEKSFDVYFAIASLIIFGPLLFFLWREHSKSDTGALNFAIGSGSELKVQKELMKLPDGYSIFPHILLPNSYGDIDFVVVGKNKVFAIECKTRINASNITSSAKPIKQIKGLAKALHDFLLENLKKDLYITPILVSAKYSNLHFGKSAKSNTFVINTTWLNEVILEVDRGQKLTDLDSITSTLASTYK